MSNQTFTAAQREAFHRAYAGKCAYTRQPVDMSSFHIDHIVPETLSADQQRLAAVKAELGLAAEFDLFGYENLVPVAPGVNLQKGKIVFDPHIARYYLGIAAAKKASIEEELGKIERRHTKGRALLLLQEALESGKLQAAEVAQILDDYQEAPEAIFKLLESIAFDDSGYVNEIARSGLDALKDRPVFGGDIFGDESGLTLEHDSLKTRVVRTCREFDQAVSEGYYPATTIAIKVSALFEHRSGLLRALERAGQPTISYIDSPRAGITDLHLLPYRLFPNISPDLTEEQLSGTYQDKLSEGAMVVKDVRQNSITVESNYMGQRIIEVARADFNGDGIEDILLFEYAWATEGTLGFGGVRVFTRTSADGLFEEVELR